MMWPVRYLVWLATRWLSGFTATPVCGDDCGCRAHDMEDRGVAPRREEWL
jgi:hypothetical protein